MHGMLCIHTRIGQLWDCMTRFAASLAAPCVCAVAASIALFHFRFPLRYRLRRQRWRGYC